MSGRLRSNPAKGEKMKFDVRRVKNGLILEVKGESSEVEEEIVFQENYDDEVEGFANFLRYLNEEYGPSTNRYSPKRIYIRVEPGDKFMDGKSE